MANHFHIDAIRKAAHELLAFAAKAEKISVYDHEGEGLRAVGSDLRYIAANIIDPLIQAYGEYAAENSPYKIDVRLFKSVCHDGLDGNGLYEIEDMADRVANEFAEEVA